MARLTGSEHERTAVPFISTVQAPHWPIPQPYLVPVSRAMATPITTIEGLSTDGSHPVQLAWKEFDVPQCGYCQSGMILAAAALLAKTPKPTDDDIDRQITNACRCGTYHRVRQAIHRAAAMRA